MSDVSNLTLQPTAVVDAQVAPLPPLPDALMKMEGVPDWWERMKLNRERDKETLYRLGLTRATTGGRGGGAGLSRITAIGRSTINANATVTTTTSTTGGSTTVNNTTPSVFDNDSLLLAWIGL